VASNLGRSGLVPTRPRAGSCRRVAPVVVAGVTLIASACGNSNDRGRDFEGLVRQDIGFASRDNKPAGRRGQLESVHCDHVQKFARSELAGCTINFSHLGAERWFVLISDQLYVLPCPTRQGALASLVADVCSR
jgi:hypothetical protein